MKHDNYIIQGASQTTIPQQMRPWWKKQGWVGQPLEQPQWEQSLGPRGKKQHWSREQDWLRAHQQGELWRLPVA